MSISEQLPSPPHVSYLTPPRYARMTEDQFLALCNDDARAEWVDGDLIMMSPVSSEQDDLNTWIASVMRGFVEQKKLGLVRGPNFTVRLADQQRRRIPDVMFIQTSRCDLIRPNHLEGAPDLAVEIVGPESAARDWREKYLEYQAAGVREYWVIDPLGEHVEVYVLAADALYQRLPEADGYLKSTVLAGLNLKTLWLWKATRPLFLDALRELGVI